MFGADARSKNAVSALDGSQDHEAERALAAYGGRV